MNIFVIFCTILFSIDIVSLKPQDGFLEEWEQFKTQRARKYESKFEEKLRMLIYKGHRNLVDAHNEKYESGEVTYKIGINKFADVSLEEFVLKRNGFKQPSAKPHSKTSEAALAHIQKNHKVVITELDFVDWRDKAAVTNVKDQGDCGSCWAFSTTGALEGQHFLKTGELISLSEQSLMDCSAGYGTFGCDGGFMDDAFDYIKDNNGIATESSYPYEALQNNSCHYHPSKRGATVTGHIDLTEGDENLLRIAVATIGPISVAIDASHDSFKLYESGLFYEPECSSQDLSHAVLVVGYGTTQKGEEYWLIKNSWGKDWGMDGYMMMARNKDNHCGIATAASFPIE